MGLLDLRVDGGHADRGVIVRASREVLDPRFRADRRHIVLVGQECDVLFRQIFQDLPEQFILIVVAGPVELEVLEEKQGPVQVLVGESLVHRVEGVARAWTIPCPCR